MPMAAVPRQRSVPLVRIEGLAPDDAGEAVTPERLAADPRLLRRFKTKRTRQAELALELGDCLYFYVGYACPDFGDMVFVFDPVPSAGWPGTATPFDTGGTIGYIHADGLPGTGLSDAQRKDATPLSDGERAMLQRYVHARRTPDLRAWQREFEGFIATYFDCAGDYVRGEMPKSDEGTGRHREPNERRAWTWEIQKHLDHDIFDGLWLLRMSFEKEQKLTAALESLSRDVQDPWWAILEDRDKFLSSQEWEKRDVWSEADVVIRSWLL